MVDNSARLDEGKEPSDEGIVINGISYLVI